jgi:AcrR family transcriptional regulator
LRRSEIVAVAIDAADRGELDALTMRGIADELGVTAMSLYAHVHDKDDLLDEVIDHLLARAELPNHDLDWRAWMMEAAQRLHALFLAQPALLDRYRRRPVGVRAALRRMEAALDVLERGGFSDSAAVEAFAAVHTYTIGFVSLATARDISRWRQHLGATFDEASTGYWPAYFASLDPAEFPVLTRLRPDLADFTGLEWFRKGLDAILDGLAVKHLEATA